MFFNYAVIKWSRKGNKQQFEIIKIIARYLTEQMQCDRERYLYLECKQNKGIQILLMLFVFFGYLVCFLICKQNELETMKMEDFKMSSQIKTNQQVNILQQFNLHLLSFKSRNIFSFFARIQTIQSSCIRRVTSSCKNQKSIRRCIHISFLG